MAHINLLPWRENFRREQQRKFVSLLGLTAVIGAGLMLASHMVISGDIDNQKSRNDQLKLEITEVDKRIKTIKNLDNKKQALLDRMEIIQQLQRSRPEIVHLFDELVTTLPDGLHLTKLAQSGNKLTLSGRAESDARVSSYMRNLEASPWLVNPKLSVIESKSKDKKSRLAVRTFSLEVQKETPREPSNGS